MSIVEEKKSVENEASEAEEQVAKDLKDANSCMMIGAGVGVLGVASAITLGAVCPVCYVAVPALIGTGLVKRVIVKRRQKKKP